MAYYDDVNIWPQEHTTYDIVNHQDFVSFSGYESYDLDTDDAYNVFEFHEPKFIDHHHHLPHDYELYRSSNLEMKYFEYNYVEPKLIAYEPVVCDTGYVSYHMQYSISYADMDLGFNEPEFEEYDPTPYGGGYDIVSVYGKPLPPSDQTCYPRSKPSTIEPKVRPEPVPISIPKLEPEHELKSKPGLEPVHVPVLIPPPKPVPTHNPKPEPKPEPEPEHEPKPEPEPGTDTNIETETETEAERIHIPVSIPEQLGLIEVEERESEREREEYDCRNYGYDYPWPEYDHGYRIGVGYDYGYEKQVIQVPPIEYDPEVVDLCENMFGNWPCLARIRKQEMVINNNNNNQGITYPQNGDHNPWEDYANYIFGTPIASCNQ